MPNIIEITDFNAPELDVYARLTENQLINRHEPEKGLFIAESPKVIERALDAGYIPVSMLLEKKHVKTQAKEIITRCGEITKDIPAEPSDGDSGIFPGISPGNFPVYTAEFDVLAELTGFQLTRGVLCAMRRPKLPTVEEVCAGAKRIAILENVMNPTNVGAIFRSAAALNMDAVLLTPACSNPLYRRAIRVSMGTVFQVPWTFIGEEGNDCDWPEAGLAKLKELGFKTAAMALSDNSVPIDHPALMAEEKLAIILGTEGDGLSDATIADCDYTVKIPMSHGVDSLNVAAASAVAFWQLGNR